MQIKMEMPRENVVRNGVSTTHNVGGASAYCWTHGEDHSTLATCPDCLDDQVAAIEYEDRDYEPAQDESDTENDDE